MIRCVEKYFLSGSIVVWQSSVFEIFNHWSAVDLRGHCRIRFSGRINRTVVYGGNWSRLSYCRPIVSAFNCCKFKIDPLRNIASLATAHAAGFSTSVHSSRSGSHSICKIASVDVRVPPFLYVALRTLYGYRNRAQRMHKPTIGVRHGSFHSLPSM